MSDKLGLFREIFPVLRPGGFFVRADWLGSEEADQSERIRDWLDYSDLESYFCTDDQLHRILHQVGFCNSRTQDCNGWHCTLIEDELAKVSRAQCEEFARLFSTESAELRYESSLRKKCVIDAGKLRLTRIYAYAGR